MSADTFIFVKVKIDMSLLFERGFDLGNLGSNLRCADSRSDGASFDVLLYNGEYGVSPTIVDRVYALFEDIGYVQDCFSASDEDVAKLGFRV